jgi:hypothetical protein
MTFHGACYISSDIYLVAKRVCADDISGASCYKISNWKTQVAKAFPFDEFTKYLHFEISLIPPGGKINILAERYSLEIGG